MNRTTFLTLAVAAYCATSAVAADPRLSLISPRGGQRGTELNATFTGQNLADAEEVLSYTPGFSFKDLAVRDERRFQVTMTIAPDVPLGEHIFRVRTKTGISEMKTFWVGPYPTVAEKDPNSEFDTPQVIDMNVTVEGRIDNEDVDYYQITAKKGDRISVEIEGLRLGRTMFDPYIALLDSKRFELASSDDEPLLQQDAALSVIAPEDGNYIIMVRETSYGGSGACQYRLHVGSHPRPFAVIPAGGQPGTEVEVKLIGDPRGDMVQKIKLPEKADPNWGIFAEDADGITPSAIPFRVVDMPNVLEVEPNNGQDDATPYVGDLPVAFNGIIEEEGDVDNFKFTAKKGQRFNVRCYARALGSPLDPVMSVRKYKGGNVASNDDQGGPDSAFAFNVPDDGEYVLTVYDHLRAGGPTYFYRVEFEPITPELVLSMPKYGRNTSQERQTIEVPRGNRYAILLNTSRQNFGGDLKIDADTLPEGMTMTALDVAGNMNQTAILFESAPDAPLAGTLTTFAGKHADPKVNIPSRYTQAAQLIVANPGQSTYWEVNVNKAAVAVTDEAPFSIQVEQPKVPLVQSGTMELKVVADRKEGFDEPITIRMLYNPPGINSVTTATIPKGKNEATLRINAAGNARTETWKIVVLGNANSDGDLWVASPFADLTVAAPFVAFNFERAAVERGKDGRIFAKITQNTPFEGKAIVKLVGLPAKTTTEELELTKDMTELIFPVKTEDGSPVGRHKGLVCQVFVPLNGDQILHNVGQTELRIDAPPPPKKDEPKPKPAETVKKPEPEKPTEKPLSRLEKLRLEQQKREQEGGQ